MRDVVSRAERHARRHLRERFNGGERGVGCAEFEPGGFIMFPVDALRLSDDGFQVEADRAIRAGESALVQLEEVR